MANTKSAKKRIKVIEKKTLRNKIVKSKTKTAIKKVHAAIKSGAPDETKKALNEAISQIDKAASKGVYHRNNASRKKSRLTLLVNKAGA